MKNFLTVILGILVAVWFQTIGVDCKSCLTGQDTLAERECFVAAENEELQGGQLSFMAVGYNGLFAESAYVELHQVMQNLRNASFRIQWLVRNSVVVVKSFLRDLSRRVSGLALCGHPAYGSVRVVSWQVPSDCYVFGIRHILI